MSGDIISALLGGGQSHDGHGTLEYWARHQSASQQLLNYMSAMAQSAVPQPPARHFYSIDPKRRMTPCQAEAFNTHGLLRSAK